MLLLKNIQSAYAAHLKQTGFEYNLSEKRLIIICLIKPQYNL